MIALSQTYFNVFYPLIMTLLITIPIFLAFNIKINNIYFLLYNFLLYFILFYILKYDNSMLALIITIFITMIYSFITSRNFIISIVIPFFSFLNLSFCDIFTGFIIFSFFPYDFYEIKTNLFLNSIIGLTILILEIVISLVLKKTLYKNIFSINSKINSKDSSSKNISIFLFVDILIIIFIIITYSKLLKYMFSSNQENFNILYLVLSLLIFVVLLLTSYTLSKYIKSYVNENLISNENKYLKQYSDMLENSSMDLRRFKHDYLNIMFTLGDYINNNKIEELKNYYNNELAPASDVLLDKSNLISLLKNLKITPLKSLVSSKIVSAQTKGIEMKIEIFDEVSEVNMKTFDLCRIMGILLDNAIEASQLCNNKFIHFAIVTTDEATIFIVINSCSENCPPVYKLYETNFSTKGTNRGLGLTTVKKIINSYKNSLINTTIEHNTFKQEIIISN